MLLTAEEELCSVNDNLTSLKVDKLTCNISADADICKAELYHIITVSNLIEVPFLFAHGAALFNIVSVIIKNIMSCPTLCKKCSVGSKKRCCLCVLCLL